MAMLDGLKKLIYRPETLGTERLDAWLATEPPVLPTLDRWAFEQASPTESPPACQILNAPFSPPDTPAGWQAWRQEKSAFWWQEAASLEWTRPHLWSGHAQELIAPLRAFFNLPFSERAISVTNVARRVLVLAEWLPERRHWPEAFARLMTARYYEEARYVAAMIEWPRPDAGLIVQIKALLAASLSGEPLENLWLPISKRIAPLIERQVLPDGFHVERVPMRHARALADVLDMLAWLHEAKPMWDDQALRNTATRMTRALSLLRHSSGQIPLLGETSLPQTPDPEALLAYSRRVLGTEPGATLTVAPVANPPVSVLPEAGFAVFHYDRPSATLVFDFGDLGPSFAPGHADMGSLEVHVGNRALIVDGGTNGLEPGVQRHYFRSAAAHNSIWVPDEDQAAWRGTDGVSAWPDSYRHEVETDGHGAKITVTYENHNRRYQHQRSVYSVQQDFWVVQDWLLHLLPADRPCYSLLHVRPDCLIAHDDGMLTLDDCLLIYPFGGTKLTWTGHAPWQNQLNLISPGYGLAGPGQIIAMTPGLTDCFGWVLIPYEGDKPVCTRLGAGVQIDWPARHRSYQLTWEASGLQVAMR